MPRAKKRSAIHGRYRLDPKLHGRVVEAAAANGMSVRAYTEAALAASLGTCPTCGTLLRQKPNDSDAGTSDTSAGGVRPDYDDSRAIADVAEFAHLAATKKVTSGTERCIRGAWYRVIDGRVYRLRDGYKPLPDAVNKTHKRPRTVADFVRAVKSDVPDAALSDGYEPPMEQLETCEHGTPGCTGRGDKHTCD